MIHIERCKLATAKNTAAILENPEKITFSLCSSPSHGSMSKKVKAVNAAELVCIICTYFLFVKSCIA